MNQINHKKERMTVHLLADRIHEVARPRAVLTPPRQQHLHLPRGGHARDDDDDDDDDGDV